MTVLDIELFFFVRASQQLISKPQTIFLMQMVDLFSPRAIYNHIFHRREAKRCKINLFSGAEVVRHFDTVCMPVKAGREEISWRFFFCSKTS